MTAPERPCRVASGKSGSGFFLSLERGKHRIWLYVWARALPTAKRNRAVARTHFKTRKKETVIKAKRLNFRISEEADRLIRENARRANMTITDYVVASASGKEVMDFDWLNAMVTQLKRLGNNLNQLVVLSRQGRISTVYLQETQRELTKIHEVLSLVFRKSR